MKENITITLKALPRKGKGRGASVYHCKVLLGSKVAYEHKGRNRRDLMAAAGFVLHNAHAY